MKKALVCLIALFAFQAVLHAQSLVPSDSATVQMNTPINPLSPPPPPPPPPPNNGHLQVQYDLDGGVDKSLDSLIRFNLNSLPPGLTGANVQKASLILFVDAGGSPGTITVCELAATPVWSASTVTGPTAPPL